MAATPTIALSSFLSSIPYYSNSNNPSQYTSHRCLSLRSSSISTSIFWKPISKRNQDLNFQWFWKHPSESVLFSQKFVARTSIRDTETSESSNETLVGEDSAAFDLGEQRISSWVYFSAILGVVLFVLNVAWIDNSTGFGKAFIEAVSTLSDSHEVVSFSFH